MYETPSRGACTRFLLTLAPRGRRRAPGNPRAARGFRPFVAPGHRGWTAPAVRARAEARGRLCSACATALEQCPCRVPRVGCHGRAQPGHAPPSAKETGTGSALPNFGPHETPSLRRRVAVATRRACPHVFPLPPTSAAVAAPQTRCLKPVAARQCHPLLSPASLKRSARRLCGRSGSSSPCRRCDPAHVSTLPSPRDSHTRCKAISPASTTKK